MFEIDSPSPLVKIDLDLQINTSYKCLVIINITLKYEL